MMDQNYNIALDCIDEKALNPQTATNTAMAFIRGEIPNEAGQKLTYRNLMGLTNQMANTFERLGFKSQDRVLIKLPNCPEFPLAFFGAIKAGLLPIPLSNQLTFDEIKHVIQDSQPVALISSLDECLKKVSTHYENLKIFVVCPKDDEKPSNSHRFQEELMQQTAYYRVKETRPNDPAFCLYTSGTQGKPKAVIHAHRSIPSHDRYVNNWLNFQKGDIVFNTGSLDWSYSLTSTMMDIMRHGGCSLYYGDRPEAQEILYLIQKYDITTLMSSPSYYRNLLDLLMEYKVDLKQLRVCLSAGEKLSENLKQKFHELTRRQIFEGLDMTENSVYLTQPYGRPPAKGAAGLNSDPNTIKVLKKDLTPAGVNEEGILATHFSHPGLMLGYAKLIENQLDYDLPLAGDWFLSDDRAYSDSNQNIYLMGKQIDMIAFGDVEISPLEIETIINNLPEIHECAAVARQFEASKTQIEVFCVPSHQESQLDRLRNKILKTCQENLAPHKIPRRIHFVNQLPRTRNGKVLRRELV
jgi:acetyl-CoA synthetase